MVYLDYSATTKVDEEVLKYFNEICLKNFANSNSVYKAGLESKELIQNSKKNIANILNVKVEELIFTSGASESNNMAIKGVCAKNKGKHIITTKLEHSSVISVLNYLSFKDYEIEFVNLLEDGTVDIENLKSLMREDTVLVTICAVDSELGIRQPIEEIGAFLKSYPNCFFHSDITQCIGKDYIDLTNVDLASFSGHKFFCFKGIGVLYKREGIKLESLIHGGKSDSVFRSGTPSTELICSLSRALSIAVKDLDLKKEHIFKLNKLLKDKLSLYEKIHINSTYKSIPNILNISFLGTNSIDLVKYLDKFDICISSKSACSTNNESSISVLSLTNNKDLAESSIRISLSYKTTIEEVNYFLEKFNICYKEFV